LERTRIDGDARAITSTGNAFRTTKLLGSTIARRDFFAKSSVLIFRRWRGAVALIESLVLASFRVAIGSSSPRENVQLAIERVGIGKRRTGFLRDDDRNCPALVIVDLVD
jgi:hypothetical protein